MGKKFTIEDIIVMIGLLFLIVMSLYHISHEGYLGISEKTWGVIWGVSENGLLAFIFILFSFLLGNPLKLLFRWVFSPYFVLKLIYYFTCYSGIWLISVKAWEYFWSIILVISIIFGLGYMFYKLKRHA